MSYRHSLGRDQGYLKLIRINFLNLNYFMEVVINFLHLFPLIIIIHSNFVNGLKITPNYFLTQGFIDLK